MSKKENREKMNSGEEEEIPQDEIARLSSMQFLFSPCMFIQKIWNLQDQIQFYINTFGTRTLELPEEFIPGYQLLLCHILYRIMEGAIYNPYLLDIKEDNRLWNKFISGKYRTLYELPTATSHGKLIQNILEIIRSIKKASDWKSFQFCLSRVKELSEAYLEAMEVSTNAVDNSGNVFCTREILEKGIRNDAVRLFHDTDEIERSYFDVFRQKQKRIDKKKYYSSMSKPLSFFQREVYIHERCFLGYKFLTLYLWRSILSNKERGLYSPLLNKMHSAENWKSFRSLLESFFEELVDSNSKNTEIEGNFSFRKNLAVPARIKRKVLTPVNIKQDTEYERELYDLFLTYPVHVICEGIPSECYHIIRLILLGFRSTFLDHLTNGKKMNNLRILRIRHHLEGETYMYSYAILLDGFWWLFYRFCMDNHPLSGIAETSVKKLVEHELISMEEYVDIRTHDVLDEKEFNRFLESKKIHFLENVLRKARDFNANLRGDFLELFFYYYFIKKGFEAWVHKKYSVIGKRDIDVVAISRNSEKCRIFLVECEEATFQEEYSLNESKIKKFEEKVREIRKNPYLLLKELNSEVCTGIELNTIFATTAYTKEKPDSVTENIEFWDFQKIKEEFRELEGTKGFLSTLEKFHDVPEISGLDRIIADFFD